jgi:hypothetical protein
LAFPQRSNGDVSLRQRTTPPTDPRHRRGRNETTMNATAQTGTFTHKGQTFNMNIIIAIILAIIPGCMIFRGGKSITRSFTKKEKKGKKK